MFFLVHGSGNDCDIVGTNSSSCSSCSPLFWYKEQRNNFAPCQRSGTMSKWSNKAGIDPLFLLIRKLDRLFISFSADAIKYSLKKFKIFLGPRKIEKTTPKSCILMAVGSFFFSAAPTAQNCPELHFRFINSSIQPSLVKSLILTRWAYYGVKWSSNILFGWSPPCPRILQNLAGTIALPPTPTALHTYTVKHVPRPWRPRNCIRCNMRAGMLEAGGIRGHTPPRFCKIS